MKKSFLSLLATPILLTSIGLTSCTSNEDKLPENTELIENETERNAIFCYTLDLTQLVPGENYSYRFLWDGYNPDAMDGISGSKTDRTLTFLNEYTKLKGYYFLYLSNQDLTDAKTAFANLKRNDNLYTDKEDVVDGKYLYGAQLLSRNVDYLLYKNEEYVNMPLEIKDYTLVFACKKKTITTIEEPSSSDPYSKSTTAYTQISLEYDKEKKEMSWADTANSHELKNALNLEDERLEIGSPSFKEKKVVYGPQFCFTPSKTFLSPIGTMLTHMDDKDYISLPRYASLNGKKTDLLDETTSIPSFQEVYYDKKAAFRDALSDKMDGENNAYFDYSKVKQIILEGHTD